MYLAALSRRASAIAAPAFAAVIALAACSGGAPSAGSPTPVPSGVVALEQKEYAFTPSTLTVPGGSIRFSVHNGGSQEHEFEILKGDVVVDEVEGILPGVTKELTVALAAGDYQFMCKLNGHDLLGMKGTLTVTGG